MRILFVTNSLRMGGIETNLVLLADEFKTRGHEVEVATGGGLLEQRINSMGVPHTTLEVRLGSPAAVARDVRRLRKNLQRLRPQVVHVFSASGAVLLWLSMLGSLAGRPRVVSSIMGLQNAPAESIFLTQARNYFTTLGAWRVLVISPEIGRLLRRLPIRRSRLMPLDVVGIRRPLDLARLRARAPEVRAALGVPQGCRVVTTVGALAPRKSHEMFIQASARVLETRDDVWFGVVGIGPQRDFLQREIDRLGVGGRVRLIGLYDDLWELLTASDVYVKPGVVEGFIGITVLEAQACGVPVVAFETEDVKLAVTHDETGVLVPRGDTSALADEIVRLLDDAELRAAITKGAAEQVRARFAIGPVVDGLEALYRMGSGGKT